MNNADFWASIRGIIAEGFTPEGLLKLDSYAERTVYQRKAKAVGLWTDTLFVVYCDIRINTPELRLGGTRTLSTKVRFLTSNNNQNLS